MGCQEYPFELRLPRRVEANEITEVVATVTPADILFVIDNSGSMGEEIAELQRNVELFVTELAKSDNDFRVGIVTTDLECNIPTKSCGTGGTSSLSCCNVNPDPPCTDQDTNGDSVIDASTCDAGRLRASPAGRRVFTRPAAAERDAWAQELVATIEEAKNDLNGSPFEAGLENARRAVACSVGDASCPDSAILQLNQGFIRAEADLVVIFLTDEDDCSVPSASTYQRPTNPGLLIDQATHFCAPTECYAHYGAGADSDGDGVDDWSDSVTAATQRLRCEGIDRQVNPPTLSPLDVFVTDLARLKGGVGRVRAAGILSAMPANDADLGYSGSACINTLAGASPACGCIADQSDFYCLVTGVTNQQSMRLPPASPTPSGGCTAAPGGRYVTFLEQLATARIAAGGRPDTLVESICENDYSETLYRIVNNVILTNCFSLGDHAPTSADGVRVTLNGRVLLKVESGSTTPGFSYVEGEGQVCLEGGVKKAIADRFEILVLTSDE